ncbi:CDGSH iron-sulfur domain-containing protein [Streptacidiphilus sp. PB12-B1b]|nr:CDGSH iron-sulfur domain-containing protein [Streptacidiphilus sp. PB12-B1b]QMU80262.1 CDGSH iron-sulfur domain-containing protein [Streptacidiphilus sp. PB12-B1b]
MPGDSGPILVEGPVEVQLPDGTLRVSERPVVALCACRRSRHYPFCDTSHRRRSLPPSAHTQADASANPGASADPGTDSPGSDLRAGRVGQRDA